jgi:hypothetical protein
MKSKLDLNKFIEPKKDFREGDTCPNCSAAPLKMSAAVPTTYQRRYAYVLYCKSCGFKYLRKFAVTGSGRIKKTGFTDTEFISARNKLLLGRKS